MWELINDPFYEEIKAYNRCIIDFCLVKDDKPHQGFQSHKDVLAFAMSKVMERYVDAQQIDERDVAKDRAEDIEESAWSMDISKAKAEPINPVSFLQAPNVIKKDSNGKLHYACKLQEVKRGKQLPYWYAFLETPHITGYDKNDFLKINNLLFPNGSETLEVYEWSTDWSNYFDDGHEWWGAACWSIYDRSLNRYVVILASTTD